MGIVLENSLATKELGGHKRRPPLAVTETLVWVGRAAGRQAGNQWKREVILNVHQGLCFSPVA